MKKFICAFLLVIFCFAGCANTANVPEIDGYSWVMTTVQGKDGKAVACGEGMSAAYEGAKEIALTCEAADGKFTINNPTDEKDYSGTYSVEKRSPESVIYKIKIGDTEGYAATAMTTYLDESQTPTFNIAIGDYALNFKSSAQK